MAHNAALDGLSSEQLRALLEIYCKDWLAMDGVWFQAVERRRGMDEAMDCDVEIWTRFTVIEAEKIKKFLGLPEHPGLEGLEQAMRLRLYANINREEYVRDGSTLLYRTLDCRVQSARQRKGMPFHPCRSVGIAEYSGFARAIDDRIRCEAVSCYPEITDESCACSWRFILEE